MSWRRSSRLCSSTSSLASADAASQCRLIREERRVAAEQAAGLAQRLTQADRLRAERVLTVRHAACLVAAIRAARPARLAAEQQRRQALLSSYQSAELCPLEDELSTARRREEAVLLARWRRRLARGDAARLQAVQAEQAARLAELAGQQAQLEQEIYQGAAAVACCPALEVPAGALADWRWLPLLDTETQHEVRDNCAVVDCAYMQRLAGIWARHGFCGGPADFGLQQLAGFLASVQFCPEDAACCWAYVERVFPPQTPGRDELMADLMARLRPALSERQLAVARARRRRWAAALAAHAATVHDWRLQKEVLGRQLEAQLCAWVETQCRQQETQRERALTLQRCQSLRRQVDAWRERVTAEVRERDAAAARRDEEARQQAAEERARQEARRGVVRQRVAVFQERRRAQERQRRQLEEERAAELERRRHAEAAHHQQRVRLRDELRGERYRQQQQRRQVLAEHEAEQQRRLDQLRSEVRVEAERDPARLLADTRASRARQAEPEPAPAAAAANHSFWDSQLESDRRLRLEARLRDAGLLESGYARSVLRAVCGEARPHLRPAHDWAGGDQ